MALDLLAVLVLIVFAALGAFRGGIASGAGLVTLVLAYAAGLLGAQALGTPVGARLGNASVLGPVVAGSGAFLAVFAIGGVASALLRRWDRGRLADEPRSACDRLAGALFGSLRGVLVVFLLAVLANWLDAARDMGVLSGFDGLPDTSRSVVGEASSRVVEGAVSAALGDGADSAGARVAARVAARPKVALESFRALLDDARVQAVQGDKFFWTLVEHGAGERAMNQISVQAIVQDPAMRQQLADLGLVAPEAAADRELFRDTFAAMLSELGPMLGELRRDPELLRLAQDPEIAALVEAGDTFALMTRPEIARIVARVTKARAAQAAPLSAPVPAAAPATTATGRG